MTLITSDGDVVIGACDDINRVPITSISCRRKGWAIRRNVGRKCRFSEAGGRHDRHRLISQGVGAPVLSRSRLSRVPPPLRGGWERMIRGYHVAPSDAKNMATRAWTMPRSPTLLWSEDMDRQASCHAKA